MPREVNFEMILSDPNASAKVIAGGLLHRDGRVHASPKTKVIGMDGRRDAVAAIRSEVKAPTWEPHSDRSASAPLPARTLERAGDTAHLVPAMPLPTVKIGRYTDPVPGTEVVKGTGIAVPQFSISTSPAPHQRHTVPKGHLPPPPPAVAPRRAAKPDRFHRHIAPAGPAAVGPAAPAVPAASSPLATASAALEAAPTSAPPARPPLVSAASTAIAAYAPAAAAAEAPGTAPPRRLRGAIKAVGAAVRIALVTDFEFATDEYTPTLEIEDADNAHLEPHHGAVEVDEVVRLESRASMRALLSKSLVEEVVGNLDGAAMSIQKSERRRSARSRWRRASVAAKAVVRLEAAAAFVHEPDRSADAPPTRELSRSFVESDVEAPPPPVLAREFSSALEIFEGGEVRRRPPKTPQPELARGATGFLEIGELGAQQRMDFVGDGPRPSLGPINDYRLS